MAAALQFLAIYAGLGGLGRLLFPTSYLLLVPFIWANRRRIGILVVGIGLALNLLAIVSNGGLMPISPETLKKAGLEEALSGAKPGEAIPGTKDILLEREDTRLWFLSDVLVWENPTSIRAFSVGDVLIVSGILVTLGELFLTIARPWRRREPRPNSRPG